MDYLLVAYPDELAMKDLKSEQTWFNHRFPEVALKPIQLEIARFSAKEVMEETLERWIGNICALQSPIEIELNNFSSIPPHIIYARVQHHHPFLNLVDKLKIVDGFIQSGNCPPVAFTTRPIIPIASGLSKYIFEEAEKFYSGRTFHTSFFLQKIELLKRDGVDKSFRRIQSFTLSCLHS